jgi:hypothetical protein
LLISKALAARLATIPEMRDFLSFITVSMFCYMFDFAIFKAFMGW